MKKRKRFRIKYKNAFTFLLFIFFTFLLIFSIIKIINWDKDNKKIEKNVEIINEIVEVEEVKDNETTEIINPPEETPENKFNPYWDYIKIKLIDVDFSELKKINSESKGWIVVNGTNVNYPFVQGKDNDYYLKHAFDKSYNDAGWIFLDYRNNVDSLDKNTIIYGHGRINNTMFGSLRNIIKNNWYKDTNNRVIKMSTESSNTLWQVFSVYRIPTTNDYLQTIFSGDSEYTSFLEKLKNRSAFDFETELNSSDKILTLSTCYDDYDKVVIHAKLIKVEKK